ncbi:MAG TPA: aminoglycoside phosphotransferase family protein [Polyangiaceae bacterium]|nr:aminoglycoside phosphotransferase family protein [Polyangiaceae bacterium]
MEEGWERSPRLEITLPELSRLTAPAFPGRTISRFEVITSGLANTNVRFWLRGQPSSYVFRAYTRDPGAAQRERDLMQLLVHRAEPPMPLPPLVYAELAPAGGGPPYSIWGFVDGLLLQDLFKTLAPGELVSIAGACGEVLASLSKHRFGACGAFGPGLTIGLEYGSPSRFVPEMIHAALFQGRAGARLGRHLRDALWRVVERTSPLLAELDGHYTLVHGDYKRSNLLLRPAFAATAPWCVAAVLDWEFAFAGPPLTDVGLFLRAGKALPVGFSQAFVSGYRAAGGELACDWLPLSRLLDLVSQMTFLNDERERPRVFAETTAVVKESIELLT